MTKTRMRFLLVGDTHGQLGVVNELAARTHADAVIHAGDFGFYDEGSYRTVVAIVSWPSTRWTSATWAPLANRSDAHV